MSVVRPCIVTIDGPAGSGKSTVAKRVALALHLPYLDTGAMYRWVAYRSVQLKISPQNEAELVKIAEASEFRFPAREGKFFVEVSENGGPWVTLGTEIRTQEIAMLTSDISRQKNLRAVLVRKQQVIGSQTGAVAEGRDAGTVIFPKATVKFYVFASPEVRARRRHEELVARMGDQAPEFEQVLKDVNLRDSQDGGRTESPMKPAENSIQVDTSSLSEEEVFRSLMTQIPTSKP